MGRITVSSIIKYFSNRPAMRTETKIPAIAKLISWKVPVHISAAEALKSVKMTRAIKDLLRAPFDEKKIDPQGIIKAFAFENILRVEELNLGQPVKTPIVLAKDCDITGQKTLQLIVKGYQREIPVSSQGLLNIEFSQMPKIENKNIKYKGFGGSGGIGIGRILLWQNWEKGLKIEKYTFNKKEEVEKEINRFREAVRNAKSEIDSEITRNEKENPEISKILNGLWLLTGGEEIPDPQNPGQKITKLELAVRKDIIQYKLNAEHILQDEVAKRANILRKMSDPYMRERAGDVEGVGRHILGKLMGIQVKKPLEKQEENVVLVVPEELCPTDYNALHEGWIKLKGIITGGGGPTSHTAIIAQALGVPAVVGIGDQIKEFKDGDKVVVNGGTGQVIVEPDDEKLKKYELVRDDYNARDKTIRNEVKGKRIMINERTLPVCGNIVSDKEISSVFKEGGTGGVGLFRTEFLYSDPKNPPTEEILIDVFKNANAGTLEKITVRTYDFGGDKTPPAYLNIAEKDSISFMGLRGVRLYDHNDECSQAIRTQLRAILRASDYNPKLEIMVPMISRVDEFRRFKDLVNQIKEELKKSKIGFNPNIKVGAMIEIPAIAQNVKALVKEADFLSIGTNDLLQFYFASDRHLALQVKVNSKFQQSADPFDKGFLQMIWRVIHTAREAEKPVSVCGNEGSDPLFDLLLVGMGIGSISVNSWDIPKIKYVLLVTKYEECRELLRSALKGPLPEIQGASHRDRIKYLLTQEGFSSELLQRVDFVDKVRHLETD